MPGDLKSGLDENQRSKAKAKVGESWTFGKGKVVMEVLKAGHHNKTGKQMYLTTITRGLMKLDGQIYRVGDKFMLPAACLNEGHSEARPLEHPPI